VASGANYTFSSDRGLVGITHTAGSANIVVTNAGTYSILFTVYLTNNSVQNIAVAVNGVVVDEFTMGAGSGEVGADTMLALHAGDIVTIRNIDNNTASLTAAPFISAYVLITRLA